VFVTKKNAKLTFKQKVQKLRYTIKRACVERTLKSESHSMDEVIEYIINKYGFVELDKSKHMKMMKTICILL